MTTQIHLVVDGKSHTLSVDDPNMPLLYALRDELGSPIRISVAASRNAAPAPSM